MCISSVDRTLRCLVLLRDFLFTEPRTQVLSCEPWQDLEETLKKSCLLWRMISSCAESNYNIEFLFVRPVGRDVTVRLTWTRRNKKSSVCIIISSSLNLLFDFPFFVLFLSLQSHMRLAVTHVRRSKSQEYRQRKTSTEKYPQNNTIISPPKVRLLSACVSIVAGQKII